MIVDTECEQPSMSTDVNYHVLGHRDFIDNKKIHIASKWITFGETFSSDLKKKKLAKLDTIGGLQPLLAEKIKTRIKRWYPVQSAILPQLIADTNYCSVLPARDIVISAPTGSGKTLCYVIPILNAIRNTNSKSAFALIVVPVQNLVHQIEKEFKSCDVFGVRIVTLCGNQDLSCEKRDLPSANIVIATPGRLMDHITDLDFKADFTRLRYLIIDEADRMSKTARVEWLDDLEFIAQHKHNCVCVDDLFGQARMQKILLSATMSLDVEELSEWRLHYPRLFRATKDEAVVSELSENEIIFPSSLMFEVVVCERRLKPLAIYHYIEKKINWNKILVFVNSRLASYRLALLLQLMSCERFKVEELSSNLFGKRRQKVLARFKKGTTRVLISSDVLSRGIDVNDIDVVINYDAPQNNRLLVHRVGRTARCGKSGTAISLVTPFEKSALVDVLKSSGCSDNVNEEVFSGAQSEEFNDKFKEALEKMKEKVAPKQTKKSRLKTSSSVGKRSLSKP